jgi:hypothetical protein
METVPAAIGKPHIGKRFLIGVIVGVHAVAYSEIKLGSGEDAGVCLIYV